MTDPVKTATPTPATPARRETLNLRISAAEHRLIDRAAQSSGKTKTDFILGAARRAAEEALLDRTVLSINSGAYAQFLARLDAPPKPNQRLRRTMRAKPPWSRG